MFSPDGTLISASAAPYWGSPPPKNKQTKEQQREDETNKERKTAPFVSFSWRRCCKDLITWLKILKRNGSGNGHRVLQHQVSQCPQSISHSAMVTRSLGQPLSGEAGLIRDRCVFWCGRQGLGEITDRSCFHIETFNVSETNTEIIMQTYALFFHVCLYVCMCVCTHLALSLSPLEKMWRPQLG